MKVDLLDHMGSDLSVVNAARVSYAKYHDYWQDNDQWLLQYLAGHGHWSPFSHPQLSFRITASIAVARQLFRHQVGLAVNEVSRRYVSDEPTFDLPEVWRSAPGKGQSKQGSGEPVSEELQKAVTEQYTTFIERSVRLYNTAIIAGVAPEQARLVLPMATETSWIWTGSLMAYIRVCKERLAPDAQAETRAVAVEIHQHLSELYPHSVKAWGLTGYANLV